MIGVTGHGPRGALRAGRAPGAIFTRFTLRSLAANRMRTVVTVVGIALAAGLLTAVLASVSSLRQGLMDRTRATDGVYQLAFQYTDAEKIDELRAQMGEHLDRLAVERDLGAAPLSAADAESLGTFLGVMGLPQEQGGTAHAAGDEAFDVTRMPEATEGRLPEAPGEICLPSYLRGQTLTGGASSVGDVDSCAVSDGAIELGSRVTLALGRRVAAGDPSYSFRSGATYFEGDESLVDVGSPRTYSVVGFYDPSYASGNVALVCPEEDAATASGEVVSMAYLSTTGYQSSTQMSDELAAIGVDSFQSNRTLLMYQGLERELGVTRSFEMIAATLAVVIMVAAVSLISNSFAISISERTRQFGLLSSLGASRRQLRRTVLTEAAVLGLAAIPVGVCLGLAGAAVAFALTAEGWSAMLGEGVSVGLVVRPGDLALAVALSAVTLVVSAWAPAARAGRVSAVDAIRSARDVRPSRRLQRAFARRRGAMDDLSADGSRPRGLATRLGGMPAFLARRTLDVSAGKSRVAAVSLAVSVALLVTAGLIGDYLGASTSYIDTGSADLNVYVTPEGGFTGTVEDAPVARMNELVGEISKVGGIERASAIATGTSGIRVDPAHMSADALATFSERSSYDPYGTPEGYAQAIVHLVDDATWREMASELGVDGSEADPANLSCVVLNAVDVNDGNTYGTVAPLEPDVERLSLLAEPDDLPDDQWVGTTFVDGQAVYGVLTVDDSEGTVLVATPEEAGLGEVEVSVAACVDDLGDSFPAGASLLRSTNSVTVLMPERAVAASEAAGAVRNFSVAYYMDVTAGADDVQALSDVEETIAGHDDLVVSGSTNLAELVRESRSMEYTIVVFLYCFTAITMAIAVANVFNTIASALMLRTREFAVLQSAGMGRRSFRRMIVLECADFAAKGLVGGVALAALVNVALFQAMSLSIGTLAFDMPWGHVALSCAVVALVLAASALYALRKSHALSLVEALRTDAL